MVCQVFRHLVSCGIFVRIFTFVKVAAAYDDFNRRETGDHTAEAALLASVKMQARLTTLPLPLIYDLFLSPTVSSSTL